MDHSLEKSKHITPRIIIHGGAGNILPTNLPRESYNAYRTALLSILHQANAKLSQHGSTALDVATYAVSLLENDPLFNAGHGAVFTTAETHELEASVMVSNGYRKRGVGVMGVKRVRNPIKLAREMLIKGEEDDGGGAQGHNQLHGETCDRLAEEWGLDLVSPSYYWTRRRWDEHRRGLGLEHGDEEYRKRKREVDGGDVVDCGNDPSWNGWEYLPQGTVGAVVLDSMGTICAATSTGGLTNKLPGRIGDTPSLGAGFWAEEWFETKVVEASPAAPWSVASNLWKCLPYLSNYRQLLSPGPEYHTVGVRRAVGMSGTGNGDSFLRTNAVHTAANMAKFTHAAHGVHPSLQWCVGKVVGPDGILQQSAGNRWKKTGEGEGGIIGVEVVDGKGSISADFNCGGMFRAWIDKSGEQRMAVFREEGYK